MKTLRFEVVVEDLPDHAKDYRVQGDVCAASTNLLRKGYPDGQVNVVVTPVSAGRANGRPVFYLWFDPQDNRYQRHDYGLHCGDGIEALIDGAWRETRIEHSSSSKHSYGWYLPDFPNQPLDNLPVRKAA
jgi:hypothetical protein